ncbi:MAG: hypothetical protein M3512_01100 [Bacteroidota bacterium]|nr:hypothetical protein [Bacteroidota bacterium]
MKDDKVLVNIDPEEEKYMVNEAIENYCYPPISVNFEELDDHKTGLLVLIVIILNSSNKPHSCKISDNEWRTYFRSNDKSMLSSNINIAIMKKGLVEKKN